MDFAEEYDAMSEVPLRVAITYKCLELFKVVTKDGEQKRGIYFGKTVYDSSPRNDFLEAMKTFIKNKKAALRNCAATPVSNNECVKIIWFLYHKLLEHGIFTDVERRDIVSYLDICEYVVL
jgi:hypothetical protein